MGWRSVGAAGQSGAAAAGMMAGDMGAFGAAHRLQEKHRRKMTST